MRFFPAILIAYIAGILAMRLGAADAVWTTFQLNWLNWGAGLLVSILAVFVVINGSRQIAPTLRTSAMATLLIVGALSYGQRFDIMMTFSETVARTVPTAAVANPDGTADVKRHWDGHFRAEAVINGQLIDMLVDTGASLVLLTYADAVTAGVDTDALQFNVPILTANGRSHVATLTIDQINIGGVVVNGVEAAVAERGQLHASLLGMSFIGEIEEAIIRKDRLILKN